MDERNNRGNFTEDFKRKIVTEIELGTRSRNDVIISYGIQGHSTILKWCRQYGGNPYPIMRKTSNTIAISNKDDQVLLLQNQIKGLERELKESRLKQATLETLIDIAERHHSIIIKKNTGGKQSIK